MPAAAYLQAGEVAQAAAERGVALRAFTAALRLDPGSEDARKALRELGVDPDTVAERVTLTAEDQQAFVGVYEGRGERGDVVLTVASKAEQLITAIEDGPTMPMEPTGTNSFGMFDGVLRLEFTRDEAGKVTQARFFAPDTAPVVLTRRR